MSQQVVLSAGNEVGLNQIVVEYPTKRDGYASGLNWFGPLGTGLPVEAASTARIAADPALLSEFIIKVLGFAADDPVFISDKSSLCDFGDEEVVDGIRANIQEHFGLTLDQPEPVVIADVLKAIRQRR